MLAQRESDVARVLDLVGGPQASAHVVLVAEPGAGRSAVLAEVGSRLRVRGVSVIADGGRATPWSAVCQVVRQLQDDVDELPDRERRLLHRLAGTDADPPPRPLSVAAAMSALVGFAADRAPIVLLIDDVAWLDRPSVDALLFAVTHAGPRRPALVVAARSSREAPPLEGPVVMTLEPLSREQSLELLAGRGVPGDLRAAAAEYCGGNLAGLVEVADRLLEAGEPARPGSLLVPGLDATARYARHAARLGARAHLALVVEALRPSHVDPLSVESVPVPAPDDEELQPAVSAGLLITGGPRPRFRHPLARDAVLRAAEPSLVRQAHEILSQPRRHRGSAWGAAATSAPIRDDGQARELAGEAKALLLAGDPGTASRLLLAASEAAETRTLSAQLRSDAGHCALAAGLPDAEVLLDSVLEEDAAEIDRVQPLMALGLLAASQGRRERLAELAGRAERRSLPTAAALHVLACAGAWTGCDQPAFLEHAAWCERASANAPTSTARMHVDLVAIVRDITAGRPPADLLMTVSDVVVPAWDEPEPDLASPIALVLLHLGRIDLAHQLLERSLARARRRGALPAVSWIQATRALMAPRLGDPAQGVALALEAMRLEAVAGPLLRPVALAALAASYSWLGDADSVARYAAAAEESRPDQAVILMLAAAVARVECGRGQPGRAADRLGRALANIDGSVALTEPWLPLVADLAAAETRSGRREQALAHHGVLADLALATSLPQVRANEAFAALCVGEDDEVDRLAANALALRPSLDRIGRAEVQLWHGERLRRAGRTHESRRPLSTALSEFHALGMRDFVRRASQELDAAGAPPTPTTVSRLSTLTPQERIVADQAAEGASTKEIAAALFLSPKTVETHLAHAYQKLGVHNRAQLVRALGSP